MLYRERELIWKEVSTTKYLMTYSVILPTIWMIFCIRSVIWRDGNISQRKSWKFRPAFQKLPTGVFWWFSFGHEGFIPMIGAMMLATIYIPLRRWAGASIGIAMPLMLSSYEFLVGSQQKIPETPGSWSLNSPEMKSDQKSQRGKAIRSSSPTILWLGELLSFGGGFSFLQYSGKGGFPLSC